MIFPWGILSRFHCLSSIKNYPTIIFCQSLSKALCATINLVIHWHFYSGTESLNSFSTIQIITMFEWRQNWWHDNSNDIFELPILFSPYGLFVSANTMILLCHAKIFMLLQFHISNTLLYIRLVSFFGTLSKFFMWCL